MRWICAIGLVFSSLSGAAYAQHNSATPAAIVQAHVDAYAAADFEAFMATFSRDAIVVVDGQRYSGISQLRQIYYANFLEGAPQMYVSGSSSHGNTVILEEGYIFPDGKQICCSSSIFTIANDKIVKVEVTNPL